MSISTDIAKPKSKRGRKPITYSKEDLEREPMLTIICGETGVGKTYRMLREIEHYMKDNHTTGKKARKVLVFDVNDDDYPMYKTVNPNNVKALTLIQARRIRPIKRNGMGMSIDEKKEVVDKILDHYRNGLIVLDDLDDYMTGSKGQSMIGTLCTVRHKGLDIVISHQSISKIDPSEFQNCTWLRLHKQVDDITKKIIRDRIPNYPLVRIASLIVEDEYLKACRKYEKKQISREEYKMRRSFFVYVNMRDQKIRGSSPEALVRAIKKFIDTEEESQIRRMMKERDWQGNLVNPTWKDATTRLIDSYIRFYDSSTLSPMQEEVK